MDITKYIANSSPDWATIIIAVMTIVYTIGTFLLWNVTVKSFKLQLESIKKQSALIEANFINGIYRNFKDIYSRVLSDDTQLKILSKELGKSKSQLQQDYLATFIINQAFEIYSLHKKGFISEEFWIRASLDIGTIFSWKFVKDRYGNIRKYFPDDFQEYVDQIHPHS